MTPNPPIPARTSKQLRNIIGNSDDWLPEVVSAASRELLARGYSMKKQEALIARKKKQREIERKRLLKKGEESYSRNGMILLILFGPIYVMIFQDFSVYFADAEYKKKNTQGMFLILGSVLVWGLCFWGIGYLASFG